MEYFALTEAYSRHDRENEDKIKQLFLDNKQYFQMAYSIENKVLVTHAGVTLPWYCLMFKGEVKKFVLQDLISVDTLEDYIGSFKVENPYNRELSESNFNNRFNNNLIPVLFEDNIIGLYDKETDTYIKKFSIEPDAVAKHINDNFLSDPNNYSFERHGSYYDCYGTTPTQSCVWIRPQSLYEHNLYQKSDFIQVVGHTQLERWEVDEKIYFVDNLGSNPTSFVYENGIITSNNIQNETSKETS